MKIELELVDDQIEMLCKHFDRNREDLEEYEIGELLDELIDQTCTYD